MDRLAAEGASFSRAYANCPICTPSRGTIFSGRHAHAGPEKWERFDPDNLEVRANFHDSPEMRKNLATYYAMIENLDWNIGRLNECLQNQQGFENTLQVYFSDHGDYMGSHGVFNMKEHPHEESVRIPAIFHWPDKLPAQGPVDGLFSLVDLMATTLGLAGCEVPVWSQGRDFSPHLRGETFTPPEDVLLEMCGSPRWNLGMPDWRGLVNERWKYAFIENRIELLYDLANDPFEQHNLAPPGLSGRIKELP
jgi:arylsulfatase A-like enzyme